VGVSLRVGANEGPVGTSDFLFAFFSTVAVRLEREGWGTRFPVVMRELYGGRLEGAAAERARGELARIRAELAAFAPEEGVWDAEDRSRRPPWGEDIAPEITSLADYFVTEDGRDLLGVLDDAVGYAARSGRLLTVR
jgi:Immunity protein 70